MDLLHVAATPGMLRSRITANSGSTNAVYYILSPTINIKANVPHLLTVHGSVTTQNSNIKLFIYQSDNSIQYKKGTAAGKTSSSWSSSNKIIDGTYMTKGIARDHILRVEFKSDVSVR